MPSETENAIKWALTQQYTFSGETVQVTKDNDIALVDKVSSYFNNNGIAYTTFSYVDLIPFL